MTVEVAEPPPPGGLGLTPWEAEVEKVEDMEGDMVFDAVGVVAALDAVGKRGVGEDCEETLRMGVTVGAEGVAGALGVGGTEAVPGATPIGRSPTAVPDTL